MAKQPTAGDLRGLYSFQRKGDLDDGFGTVVPGAGPFSEVFFAAGALIPMVAGESVRAGRLLGQQSYLLQFRSHTSARDVTSDWQIVDKRSTKIYKMTSPTINPSQKNDWLEAVVSEGVVT